MTSARAHVCLRPIVRRSLSFLDCIPRRRRLRYYACALVVLSVAIVPDHTIGALVVWGPPTTISGDADVSTIGTLFGAANVGGPAVDVNGVTFTSDLAHPNFTLSASSSVNGAFGAATPPFSALSANYRDLLDSGRFTHSPPNTPPSMTLTINNLTLGVPYQFQWWVNDSRSTGDQTRTTTATAGTSVVLEHNFQNVAGGVGQYAIGTFVADSTTQQISFQGLGGGPNFASSQINAFQLRAIAIPEPGSFLLVALVMGILASIRCYQRKSRHSV